MYLSLCGEAYFRKRVQLLFGFRMRIYNRIIDRSAVEPAFILTRWDLQVMDYLWYLRLNWGPS
jgi:hypothetical protein